MKKSLLFFMTSLALVFASCKDDDENEQKKENTENDGKNYCYKVQKMNPALKYFVCENCGNGTSEEAKMCAACHYWFYGVRRY